jgi:hypothetical protein
MELTQDPGLFSKLRFNATEKTAGFLKRVVRFEVIKTRE